MTRDKYFVTSQIITPISVMVGRVFQEQTTSGPCLEFINSGEGKELVTKAPKNLNLRIGRITLIEKCGW